MNTMWCVKVKNLQLLQSRKVLPHIFRIQWKTLDTQPAEKTTASPVNQTLEKTQVSETAPPSPEFVKVNPYLTTVQPTIKAVDERSVYFDDIPGPISLRLISKFWGMFPVMGTELTLSVVQYLLSGGKFFDGILSWGGNAPFFKKFFKVYGPVVRLHGAFGSDVVLLSRPEHASVIFQNEGPYPIRSCLSCIEKYRLDCKKYRQAGPFLMYGPDWEKLRKSIEVPLQSTVVPKSEKIDEICEEFITRIVTVRNKQEEMPNYFRMEILKWSLECLCSMSLDKKLGFLDSDGLNPTSDPAKLLSSLVGATEAISKCEYGFHMWKFFETPAFKSLMKNCDMIESILGKHLESAIRSLKENKTSSTPISLLENLIVKENIHEEDVMTVMLDMFLIGVNAITHTVAFLLYFLAKNPRCQIRLFEEIKKYGNTVTRDELKQMKYLQSCIKEVLRLNPPLPILTRILNKDVKIHQYPIPKGTYILFANHLNGTSEEYFEDALKFKPERWLSDDLGGFGNEYQEFASLPFGYGARSCVAKEMAEMEIAMLLFKVCNRFRIEYNYGDIISSNELLATPKKPLKFRFIDRI